MKMSSSFWALFWGYFLFKPCKMEFIGWLKNKDRRKMWEEEDVGAAGVFLGEGFFGIFFVHFLLR